MGQGGKGEQVWVKEVVADVLDFGSCELAWLWCQEPSLGTALAEVAGMLLPVSLDSVSCTVFR